MDELKNTGGLSPFPALLEESVRIHGHLCPGQVLGVRMSILGLNLTGIADPRGAGRKSLMVYVEMDRCATDAVQSVTGCSLGRRSLKFMDYGKMAATFVNLKTGRAVRIVAREQARELAVSRFPSIADKYTAQLEAYKIMKDEELFDTMPVRVKPRPQDMPGRPVSRVQCEACGEWVQDMREVINDGRTLCVPCSQDTFYYDHAP